MTFNSKPNILRTWPSFDAQLTLKKAPEDMPVDQAHVREILDGGATPTVVITPLAPDPANPGMRGTVLLVKNGPAYYFALAYISGEEGSLTISLPPTQVVVMDLPHGMFTSKDEINQSITDDIGTGNPPGVGPNSPN